MLCLKARFGAMVLVAWMLASPAAAGACTCTNQNTLMEEFGYAAAVFGGTVSDIQPAGDGFNVIVTLVPTVRWKGGVTNPVHVWTAENEGICGFPFAVGQSYVVFAFSGQPTYYTHLCSFDAPLDSGIAAQLPAPLEPVKARTDSWGTIKALYR